MKAAITILRCCATLTQSSYAMPRLWPVTTLKN
jgi:hypothetical protein